jgi:hypothetical protein
LKEGFDLAGFKDHPDDFFKLVNGDTGWAG